MEVTCKLKLEWSQSLDHTWKPLTSIQTKLQLPLLWIKQALYKLPHNLHIIKNAPWLHKRKLYTQSSKCIHFSICFFFMGQWGGRSQKIFPCVNVRKYTSSLIGPHQIDLAARNYLPFMAWVSDSVKVLEVGAPRDTSFDWYSPLYMSYSELSSPSAILLNLWMSWLYCPES